MICSFHHMKPEVAKGILKSASESGEPFVLYEISDNSIPLWTLPLNVILTMVIVLFVTPLVRPMTWQQIVFTYLFPLLPIFIGWDGAISNFRTYTLSDMELLVQELRSDDYQWEMGAIPGKGAKQLYLLGLPA